MNYCVRNGVICLFHHSVLKGFQCTVLQVSCHSWYCFWLTWKMWVYVMISVTVRPAGQRSECLYVAKTIYDYKYDKCQTLRDGSTHWALPIHTAFSDLDCILKSQQCHHRRPYSRGIIEMFSDLTKTWRLTFAGALFKGDLSNFVWL